MIATRTFGFLFATGVAAIATAQTAGQAGESLRLAGQVVPIEPPVGVASTVYSSEVLAWSGWGPLKGAPAQPFYLSQAGKEPLLVKARPDAIELHAKFFLYTNLDLLVIGPKASFIFQRFSLEVPQVQAALKAIARIPSAILAATDGHIKLVPDVELLTEPVRAGSGAITGGTWSLETDMRGRVNAGGYQAEDRIFRGPFAFVTSIMPTVSTRDGANDYLGVPFYSSETIDKDLWKDVVAKLSVPLSRSDDWQKSYAKGELDTKFEIESQTATNQKWAPSVEPTGWWTPAPKTSNVELSILSDLELGSVLRYREMGLGRFGGASLPLPSNLPKTLSFKIRSKSPEPVAITLDYDSAKVSYSLGDQWSARASEGSLTTVDLPFSYDGTWQTITLPVDGSKRLSSIVIGPTNRVLEFGRRVVAPVEVDIAEIKADATEVTGPNPILLDEVKSARAESRARKGTDTSLSEADRLLLLADGDREVQMNAVIGTPKTNSKVIIDAVLALANSIEPRVAQAAVNRYVELVGLETARPELVRIIKFGLTDHVRGIAAMALAETKDPKVAGDVLVLLANRTANTRLMAVHALRMLSGREAGIIRMAFIQQIDPAIKAEVTISADPNDEYQMRKLLWSAVNEPSDDIRLLSGLKLIQSNNPEFRRDGFKIIRDDSYGVRARFASQMGTFLTEANRDGLRETLLVAVVDVSPTVRAAAVKALAALSKDIQPDEIENLFRDNDPRVQDALIQLADSKKIKAPAAWVELLRKSPVSRIKEAGDRLAGSTFGGN